MIDTIKKLLLVSRVVSWPNTAYPFAAGYLMAGGTVNAVFIIGTLYFMWPYNLLMYGVNDVFDYESDIKNPRKGGIEGMKLKRAFHPTIIKASLILNIPFVIYLLAQGSLWSKITLLVLLFFVIAYSMKGLRFKEKPILDSISSSIHFVGPLVYALTLTSFSSQALPYVMAFFLWGMASHAFGAVQDIIPDREAKISSIATVLGAKNTVRFSMVLYTFAAAIVMLQGGLSIIVGLLGIIYVLNIFMYRNCTDRQSGYTNSAWRRFIWLNYFSGFLITLVLISEKL